MDTQTRNALVTAALPDALQAAASMARRFPKLVTPEDAAGVASLALVERIEKFDPTRASLGAFANLVGRSAVQRLLGQCGDSHPSVKADPLRGGHESLYARVTESRQYASERFASPAPTPEQLYLDAEAEQLVAPALAQAEAAMAPRAGDCDDATLARRRAASRARAAMAKVGVTVPADDGKTRSRRWYANLTAEQKQARLEKRRAYDLARRAARVAP